MFGISGGELGIILVFGFLLFGPDKLPQMGHTIGRALRQFRETQEKMTSMVQAEVIDPMTAAAQAPLKPKKTADGAAAEPVDTDADLDLDAPAAQPRVKETFAERRARLAAEKAAADAAQSTDEAAAAEIPASEPAQAPEPEAPAAEEAPAEPATADLYARHPRTRKAAPATDAAPEEGGEQ